MLDLSVNNNLEIDVGNRQDVVVLERHANVMLQALAIKECAIGRMLVHHAPTIILTIEQLGMNARHIHILLEELAIGALSPADDSTVDALNTDVELVAHKCEARHIGIDK